jgi:hypothetical protein
VTSPSRIRTVEELHGYLYAAMQLEHATIPPYLTALYSMRPNTNMDASHVIRVVVVEEMLHLTLAANILNAVGGTPDLTTSDFVPVYPAYLPDGEDDFQVDLQPFSEAAIDAFLKIERPAAAPDDGAALIATDRPPQSCLATPPDDSTMRFYSIGQFYEEIRRGLEYLEGELAKEGRKLFVGDPAKQVTADYYYSGGGEIIAVTDVESATAAIRLVSEQGEGLGGGIYDTEAELAHYYRFQQLVKGQYYRKNDAADHPTGPHLRVDWEAIYPIKLNARLADYEDGSELHAAAADFNRRYADFLVFLTRAYNGQPELLIEAVVEMFRIKERMVALIRNPIPGLDGVHAAPTFELTGVTEGARA